MGNRLMVIAGALLLLSHAARAGEPAPPAALDRLLPFEDPARPLYPGWEKPGPVSIVLQSAAVGLIVLDVAHTLQRHDQMSYTPRWESNPFLGPSPSKPKIILLGGVLPIVLSTAIWYLLPPDLRWVVPTYIIPVELTLGDAF